MAAASRSYLERRQALAERGSTRLKPQQRRRFQRRRRQDHTSTEQRFSLALPTTATSADLEAYFPVLKDIPDAWAETEARKQERAATKAALAEAEERHRRAAVRHDAEVVALSSESSAEIARLEERAQAATTSYVTRLEATAAELDQIVARVNKLVVGTCDPVDACLRVFVRVRMCVCVCFCFDWILNVSCLSTGTG